jgi:hypothetical protein
MRERAVWRHNPMTLSWSLHLVREAFGGWELALREEDGRLRWEARDPAVMPEAPPLLEFPEHLLRDVVLPAAPGWPTAEQAQGRVEALEDSLSAERLRVDEVLDRLLRSRGA